MNIQKATIAAMAIDGFIFRKAWKRHLRIEPSNSDEGLFAHSKYSKGPCPRWQPRAEDLMADDWAVSADLDGLVEITTEERSGGQDASATAQGAQSLERLRSGKNTTNELRAEYGLEPIANGDARFRTR